MKQKFHILSRSLVKKFINSLDISVKYYICNCPALLETPGVESTVFQMKSVVLEKCLLTYHKHTLDTLWTVDTF